MDTLGFRFPEMGDNYTVQYEEDQGGMEVLYDITNIFLDAVIGGNFFPDGFLSEEKFPDLQSVESNFLDEVINNAQPIVMTNIPILVCIVLGLILSVVTLIGGIIFCCCCRKNKNSNGNENGFKKVMLSILLFLLLVVTSLGCMWFFLGAKTSQSGLDKIPEDIQDILHDGDLYMNNTVDGLHYLLQDNFDDVIVEFEDALNKVGANFKDFTETMKNEIQLQTIIEEATSFVDLITDYAAIQGTMTSVLDSYTSMTTSLANIKQAADGLGCSLSPPPEGLVDICNALDGASGILEGAFPSDLASTAFPPLPDEATQQLSTLSEYLNSIEGQIDAISANAIDEYFPTIQGEIEKIKDFLTEALDGLTEPIEDIQGEIFRNDNIANSLEDIRDNYFPYFHISLLVLGSLLVVILAVFMVGMCLGSCSKQGSGISSSGSGMMFLANCLFFFLAIFLFILCTAFFTVGALGEKALCKTMADPGDSELVTFVNPLISSVLTDIFNQVRPETEEGEDIAVKFDLAQLISDMHNNTAIYPLLQLHYIFNIEELTDWRVTYGIDPLIEDARKQIDQIINELVGLESSLNEEEIKAVAEEIDGIMNMIDLTPLLDEALIVKIETGKIEIEELKTQLETMITEMENNGLPVPGKEEILANLQNIIEELDVLKGNVQDLQARLGQILDLFGNEDSKFDMAGKVDGTFALVTAAFEYFRSGAVMVFFDESVGILTKVVDDYVNHAIDAAENHIGNTGPLSNIYNATYTEICLEIIAPFNAVWSGLGWCLLMILIPVTLVVSSLKKILVAKKQPQTLRPIDTNGYRNPKAARAASYEEVPMPSYNERSSRINAYETKSYQNGPPSSYQNGPPSSYQNGRQSSYQSRPPPPYQQSTRR
eukprot:GFUD01030775.1.p1 GENE.GFUD01030775.1~~GFUD01030775.1.p1  ORF type:complete len:884 (-),score=189.71 GFUD01030775.1:59-2710(-)